MGLRRQQGTRVREVADGILPGRRKRKGPIRRVHAGGEEAEGVALRPVLRQAVRVSGRGRDGGRVRAAGPLL